MGGYGQVGTGPAGTWALPADRPRPWWGPADSLGRALSGRAHADRPALESSGAHVASVVGDTASPSTRPGRGHTRRLTRARVLRGWDRPTGRSHRLMGPIRDRRGDAGQGTGHLFRLSPHTQLTSNAEVRQDPTQATGPPGREQVPVGWQQPGHSADRDDSNKPGKQAGRQRQQQTHLVAAAKPTDLQTRSGAWRGREREGGRDAPERNPQTQEAQGHPCGTERAAGQ